MDDIAQFLMGNPQWQQGLAMMANESPDAGLKRAAYAQQQQALAAETERKEKVRQTFGASGGKITPELIAEIAKTGDMDTALQLQKMYQEQNAVQLQHKFNPVTGASVIIDKRTGLPISGPSGGMASPATSGAPSAPIPQEILDNPAALQTYLETLAKKNAEMGAAGAQKDAKSSSFSDTLNEMRGYVGKLQESGTLLDSTKTPIENYIQSARLTDAGQLAARAGGKPSQTELDNVKLLVPKLMQDIMAATGMSATQVNTEKEMELLKDSIGNPGKYSYQTIIENIDNLEKKYGVQKPAPNVSAVPALSGAPKIINFEDLK